jgi:hypothetical protein
MRRLLGPLLAAALLLAGCGDSTSDAADDGCDDTASCVPTSSTGPTTGPTSGPTGSPAPSDGLEPSTIGIVSQTAIGGRVDLDAVPLDDRQALQEFASQFNRGGMEEKISQAIGAATVPEGYTVMGAVVAIGCDVPPDVTVTQGPDGWVFAPQEVASPLQECFAPVTSVALVAVPA